ncbi:MAG: hypothetical protein ACRC6V_08595 [Bacteroidales bacterium]
MSKVTLFGLDTKGGYKEWNCECIGSEIHVSHGKVGGKLQLKITKCEAKNVGRANETSPERQAELEAASKVQKQIDKLYRPTIEALSHVGNNLPMLAHDYTKVGHRMPYPCYGSVKLDGVRCMAIVNDLGVYLASRGGKSYPCPKHIEDALMHRFSRWPTTEMVLDGELYIHGVSLQNIVSAVKKPNELTPELKFWIFDIPSKESWEDRMIELEALPLDPFGPLVMVGNRLLMDETEARTMLSEVMEKGYEGLMLRNPDSPYLYNHRSPGLMKWKLMQDTEVKVVSVRKDKLGEGVLICKLPSGVDVDLKMKGNHEYRLYENMLNLVGKWVTAKFQEYTDDGSLQFPVGLYVRECDNQGNPLI